MTTKSKTPVIGLGGYLGSGKDAVADRLVDVHEYTKHFMSKYMNGAVLDLNPFIPVEYETNAGTATKYVRYAEYVDEVGYTKAKENPEVRRLLQEMGWNVGRKLFGDDAWVRIVRREMAADQTAGRPTVLTGVRTANEIELIEALGGTLIWVDRPNNPLRPQDSTAAHETENSVGPDDFHQTLINDGTLADLDAVVDALARTISGGTE